MKHGLRKPCNDCPFRRASTSGWLGDGDPDYFVSAALADYFGGDHAEGNYAEPCHLTVVYEEGWQDKTPDAEVCHGAAVFYRNVDPFKLPRDPDRSKLIQAVQVDHEAVFSTVEEFVNHHTRDGSMRSWEQKRRTTC